MPFKQVLRHQYGDEAVEVLTGKDKGKIGIVSSIIKERNMCFVEGLNCEYKYSNQTNTDPGTMIKQEKPLLVTNEVALVDPSENKGTEIEWRYTEDGVRVRVSMKTGRIIPFTKAYYEETEDFVNVKTYKECSKDTKESDLTAVTFQPKLSTFEDDIMEQMGIKETRKRQEKFWY